MTEKQKKKLSITDALTDMIMSEYGVQQQPVTTAALITFANSQSITGFENEIKKTVRQLWKNGVINRSNVPGHDEAYNTPDKVIDGISYVDTQNEVIAARMNVFATVLGRCMDTWLSSRINRKRLFANDKAISAEYFGVTNEAMTVTAKEIIKYLRHNHGKTLEHVMKDLDVLVACTDD